MYRVQLVTSATRRMVVLVGRHRGRARTSDYSHTIVTVEDRFPALVQRVRVRVPPTSAAAI